MKKAIFSGFAILFLITNGFSQDIMNPQKDTAMSNSGEPATMDQQQVKPGSPDTEGSLRSQPVLMTAWMAETDASVAAQGKALYLQGQVDAVKYYKGYRGAGTGTLISGLLSPLIGLIPAIACSSTRPKEWNLNCPNAELMKNPDYYNGYTQKAKKIKQSKVWTNWGIALGANIIATLLMPKSDDVQ